MRSIIILFTVILNFHYSFGQIEIEENDVDFNILKWHFHNYPNSQTIQWFEMGEGSYKVVFNFNDSKISTYYMPDGHILSEITDLTDQIPQTLLFYAEERYPKSKILEYAKHIDFTINKTYYQLFLKLKDKKSILLRFDENLTPISSN